MKPSERFSNRVADYVRGRPGYPPGIVATLVSRFGLSPTWTIADVGAGTGISASLFLERGCTVIAVEPNEGMRAILSGIPRLRVVAAPAEATTLEAGSVDAVVAFQAFHWFDRPRFRAECLRILKPEGIAALVWNIRKSSTRFAVAYEALIREFATDYLKVRHENVSEDEIAAFFGGAPERHDFDNVQVLDRSGLRARLASSSYMPGAGEPGHDAMLLDLDRLFVEHERDGRVELPYDASLFAGRIT